MKEPDENNNLNHSLEKEFGPPSKMIRYSEEDNEQPIKKLSFSVEDEQNELEFDGVTFKKPNCANEEKRSYDSQQMDENK